VIWITSKIESPHIPPLQKKSSTFVDNFRQLSELSCWRTDSQRQSIKA